MVKYWSKAGQKMVRSWSNVGQKMDKTGYFGVIWGQNRGKTGQTSNTSLEGSVPGAVGFLEE
jgi:hypothetical protein